MIDKTSFRGRRLVAALVGATAALLACGASLAKEFPPLNPVAPDRLPTEIEGRPVAPDVGCFWSFGLEGDEYKHLVDAVAPYGAFDVLTITLRSNFSLVDNAKAVETTRKAVEYARDKYGIKSILDIDLRIARHDFERERPDLAQERLYFQERELSEGATETGFLAPNLTDHYTGNAPYFVRGGRVVKAWAYNKTESGDIDPASIVDVTDFAKWNRDQYVAKSAPDAAPDATTINEFSATFERSELPSQRSFVTCAVAFRYSYPDLFADETLELERKLYEQFGSVPAYGVAKDEWGFPPHFDRNDNLDDFWYSERMRQAYAAKFPNRDLVDDLFLAFRPRVGSTEERIESIDRFRRLCSDRVVEYEFQNYELTKKLWGDDAFVGVHCTWYPWPNVLEMRKNGIMWWKAPRDFAQTDEYAPFSARNGMAKGTDSLWINMFYARQVPEYIWEHWTAAASGGRVHIHNIYPRDENSPKNEIDPRLLPIVADGGVAKIRQKIRMLNLLSNAPIDSPVAVVFGRYGAANPLLPEYKTIGCDICDRFAVEGVPADLIPVDEIRSSSRDGRPLWSVEDGFLRYGRQKYRAIIMNGESSVERDDFDSLRSLADSSGSGKTKIFSLPATATAEEKDALVKEIVGSLKESGFAPRTPWVADSYEFDNDAERASRPPRKCVSRFLDGTILWTAAEESDFGDPIVLDSERLELDGKGTTPEISVRANGVFATRFNEAGELTGVVASELKSFRVGEFGVELSDEEIGDDPIDVALWKDDRGEWRGVFQRGANDAPEGLAKLVSNLRYLKRR
ncbi:MAG: hypothetical protein IJM30_05695 [Thermoguttaceae bacterium]|nr:hypothetical protein [Thermoguttaceae bacterium]